MKKRGKVWYMLRNRNGYDYYGVYRTKAEALRAKRGPLYGEELVMLLKEIREVKK